MMRFFDLHSDTLYRCFENNKNFYDNGFHISLEKAEKYDTYIECFAVWIPDELRGEDAFNLFKHASEKFDHQKKLFDGRFRSCQTISQVKSLLQSQKKTGIILTVEGGAAIAGKLENLEYLRKKGVRIMTLTWNGRCELGDGVGVNNSTGLSFFGKKAIKKMEKLGIIADVSHASEKLFYDVCEISMKPFIATHSNSKKICNHRRNLSDEQFKIIKNRKGLVGINFCNDFLNDKKTAIIDDILRHIDYFLELGGEKTLAFGSDFDGADVPDEVCGIEYIENLYEYFLKKNYNQTVIDDIFFNNAYNFMVKNL